MVGPSYAPHSGWLQRGVKAMEEAGYNVMLEPEIERELEGSLHEQARAALKQSLFERLFVALRKRETVDRVRRTVTLDTQFRMHPILGDFVSRTFYDRHDAAAVIKAGRAAEAVGHDVSIVAKGRRVEHDKPMTLAGFAPTA